MAKGRRKAKTFNEWLKATDIDEARAVITRAAIEFLVRTAAGAGARPFRGLLEECNAIETAALQDAVHPERSIVALGTMAQVDPALALQAARIVESLLGKRSSVESGTTSTGPKKDPAILVLLNHVHAKIQKKITPKRMYEWMADEGYFDGKRALHLDHHRYWVRGDPKNIPDVELSIEDASGNVRIRKFKNLARYFRDARPSALPPPAKS